MSDEDSALMAKIGRLVHGDFHAVHGWDTPLVNKLLEIVREDRKLREQQIYDELEASAPKVIDPGVYTVQPITGRPNKFMVTGFNNAIAQWRAILQAKREGE